MVRYEYAVLERFLWTAALPAKTKFLTKHFRRAYEHISTPEIYIFCVSYVLANYEYWLSYISVLQHFCHLLGARTSWCMLKISFVRQQCCRFPFGRERQWDRYLEKSRVSWIIDPSSEQQTLLLEVLFNDYCELDCLPPNSKMELSRILILCY